MTDTKKLAILKRLDMAAPWLVGSLIIMGLGAFAGVPLITVSVALALYCAAFAVFILMRRFDLSPIAADSVPKTVSDVEASLREQARLADGFAEAVIIINKRERILYANPAAKTLFTINEIGSPLSSIIRDPNVRELVAQTLKGENPAPVRYHIETPVERHIRVMSSRLISEKEPDKLRRAIIVFYDITDIVRVNTMRADFLANASHELKTPVASLLGYIETLRGHAKDDPEAQEAFLIIMQQQAERMQRLIDDLLSLRRIEMVEHLAPNETGDLFLATRAAMEAIKPMAKKRGVKIKYEGPEEVLVTGIQDELVQLVLNLLDNAVQFTPEKGVVRLKMTILDMWQPQQAFTQDGTFEAGHRRRIVELDHTEGRFARLQIRDEGPGFAREHLPRLAERFYKIIDQSGAAKRGTGLGLAIVKHITRRHRAGLFVESAAGQGTEFTILMPIPDGF